MSDANATSPRVLVLNRLKPWTKAGGARIRNHWMLNGLASRFRVDLLLADDADDAPATQRSMLAMLQGFPLAAGSRRWVARIADAALTGRPLYSAGIVGSELKSRVAELLATREYAAIHADLNMEAAIPRGTSVPIVYNAHNCETALQRRHAEGERFPLRSVIEFDARRLAHLERGFVDRAALITACSHNDVADLQALAPGAAHRSILIPNGVDLAQYRSIGETPFEARNLLITGSMDWRPNQLGLFWFLHEVLPLLRTRVGDVRIRVAGRMDAVFAAKIDGFAGMTAVPNLTDMQVELTRAHLILAPITASSGTRLRILEAWAAGRPVVTTRSGALGLNYTDGCELLARNEPAAFVAAICELLDSPERCRAVQEAATQRVAQYDWQPICAKLVQAYEDLIIRTPAGVTS